MMHFNSFNLYLKSKLLKKLENLFQIWLKLLTIIKMKKLAKNKKVMITLKLLASILKFKIKIKLLNRMKKNSKLSNKLKKVLLISTSTSNKINLI